MAQHSESTIAAGGHWVARNPVTVVKPIVALACLAPFAIVVAAILGFGSLGPNPVEEVLHTMGKTSLNILWVTLAITPLRKLTKWNWLIRLRRMLGLFAFFYLVLHFLTYAALDLRFAWGSLYVDITERPYITVGMLALVLMIPLAVTSTKGWQRRLGRRWVKLHRLVYPIAILATVHFWWQVKADLMEPLIYAALLALLLGYRLVDYRARVRRSAAARKAAAARPPAAARPGRSQ